MRTTGWLRCFHDCRGKLQACGCIGGEAGGLGRRNSVGAPLILMRLAHDLTTAPKLLRNRRFHLRVYRQCVPGNILLDYLVREQVASDRPEALQLAESLFDAGLLHHVCFEHEFEDAGFYYKVVDPMTHSDDATNGALGGGRGSQVVAEEGQAAVRNPSQTWEDSREAKIASQEGAGVNGGGARA